MKNPHRQCHQAQEWKPCLTHCLFSHMKDMGSTPWPGDMTYKDIVSVRVDWISLETQSPRWYRILKKVYSHCCKCLIWIPIDSLPLGGPHHAGQPPSGTGIQGPTPPPLSCVLLQLQLGPGENTQRVPPGVRTYFWGEGDLVAICWSWSHYFEGV